MGGDYDEGEVVAVQEILKLEKEQIKTIHFVRIR